MAKANPGTHLTIAFRWARSVRLPSVTDEPVRTPAPPFTNSQPVPARNPPTTGYGTKRTRLPRRRVLRRRKKAPVANDVIPIATTTVRNLRSPGGTRAAIDAAMRARITAGLSWIDAIVPG